MYMHVHVYAYVSRSLYTRFTHESKERASEASSLLLLLSYKEQARYARPLLADQSRVLKCIAGAYIEPDFVASNA